MFKDPVLKKLIKKYDAPKFEDRSKRLLESIIRSIIGQQLSGKAADTIYNRFLALFKTKLFPKTKEILEIDVEKLRGAGMSYAKTQYVKNAAQFFHTKQIDIQKIKRMSDEEVIIKLTKIKGVGKWTAEMILIFSLKRNDVFSIGDAGLRRAIKNLYEIENEKEILKLSENWKPNRSLACWYLWRSLEND